MPPSSPYLKKNKVVFSSQPTRPGRAALVSLRPFRLFVPNRDGIPHNGAGEDNEVVPGEVALIAMQTVLRPRRVAFLSLQFPSLFWEMETCSSIYPNVVSTTCFFFSGLTHEKEKLTPPYKYNIIFLLNARMLQCVWKKSSCWSP